MMISYLYFNSIKVRLKRLHLLLVHSLHFPFQFHKGTIKTIIFSFSLHSSSYFNSIKVRLKRQLRLHIRQTLLFQFHKGTIKTNNQGNINVDFNYFNSIKVRLKLGEYGSNSLRPHISIP